MSPKYNMEKTVPSFKSKEYIISNISTPGGWKQQIFRLITGNIIHPTQSQSSIIIAFDTAIIYIYIYYI